MQREAGSLRCGGLQVKVWPDWRTGFRFIVRAGRPESAPEKSLAFLSTFMWVSCEGFCGLMGVL